MSHQERITAQQTAFTTAMTHFQQVLERLDDEAARRAPADGGWSPAQVAWHVGQTNELLAGVITGDVPMATPAPAGFSENSGVFSGVPDRVKTFPQLEPPADVTRADALAKLKGSIPAYLAALQGLTSERASGYCVDFPFGKLSLYQMAEFTAAHVTRHQRQVERATAGV